MAFSYTIFYSTEIATTPIHSCGNILGRILRNGPPTLRHLEMLILFRIFKTSSVGMGYTLLRTVTQLLAIFRPLLLVQKNQYGRKMRLHVNCGNLKPTYILREATLIRNETPRTLLSHLKVLSHLEVLFLHLRRLQLLYSSQPVSLHYKKSRI